MKSKNYLFERMATAVFAITLIAVSSAHAGWLQTIPAARTANTPLFEIAFEYDADKIVVPVRINGSNPTNLILDTGMPEGIFLMDPELGRKLKLEYVTNQVTLGGAGQGAETASMAMGASFDMAGVKFEGQRVIVLNNAGELSRTDWDGAIGASIFNKYIVEIDVEKKLVKLFAPDKFDPKDAGEGLDLTITATKPYIQAPITSGDGKTANLKVVLDTGAGSSLMLAPESQTGLKAPSKFLEGILGHGVGGDVIGKVGRLKNISIGKHQIPGIVAIFNENPLPMKTDALLGMKLMGRFHMTFDYPRKRVYFKPNGRFDEPHEFDMIGMIIRPAETKGMNVIEVFDNSPAANAGITKGDIITMVDGKEATFKMWAKLVESLRKPGVKINVAWTRGDKTFEKELVTSRLL